MIRKHLFARLYRNAEPGDDGSEAVGSGNDARVAMLNSIGDANDQVRAEELAEVHDDGSTSEFKLDETAQAEIDRAEAEANQTAVEDEPPVVDDPQPKTYKLKINGREVELSEAEVIERAQKVEAADTYLNEARRIKKEAESNLHQPAVQTTPEQLGMSPEERRALARAIQMGTEEEADAALEKLLQPRQPAITPDVLARTVDERLTFKDAIDRFKSEYKDVMSDPVLASWAQRMDQDLLTQGDKRPYWDRYQSIGEEIRGWLKAKTGAPSDKAVTAPAAVDSKQQRKANAPAAPKAANSRAPAAQADDEGDESPSEVIANIAKARGGPQWMRG